MEILAFTFSVIVFPILIGLMPFVIYKLWKWCKIRQMSPRAQFISPDHVEMQIMKEERKEEIV